VRSGILSVNILSSTYNFPYRNNKLSFSCQVFSCSNSAFVRSFTKSGDVRLAFKILSSS
jgi:hypothetical protein